MFVLFYSCVWIDFERVYTWEEGWNVRLLMTDLEHPEVVLHSGQDVKIQLLTEGAPGTFAFQVCEVQFWWSDSCTQLSKNTVKEDVPTQSLYCLPTMQPSSLCTKFCLLNWPHVCSSYWDQFSRLLKVSGVAGFIFVCDFIVLLNWGQNQWWRLGLWISCFEGPQEECCILLGS